MLNHSPENWRMEGGGHCVFARCPRYFAGILSKILNGWSITEACYENMCDLSATYIDGKYRIDSIVLHEPEMHADIMNALNEFLANLAYIASGTTQGALLVHCAGFYEHEKMNIVVGAKNQGKSALMYKKAREGAEIIADDLMIWAPKVGKFFALGFPLRLRRPVLTVDGVPANPDNFFAGSGIAYSKNHAYKIAQVGKPFLLDQLWKINDQFMLNPVSLLQTSGTLKKFIIGAEYTTIRKEKLE